MERGRSSGYDPAPSLLSPGRLGLAVVAILLVGGPAFATCDCTNFAPGLRLQVTTRVGSGSCGQVDGVNNLACGDIYAGPGLLGGNEQDSALRLPDLITSVTKTSMCTPTGLVLGATTAAETGQSCTSAGCTFGPPIPIPSYGTFGTCLLAHFVGDASGTADCSTGSPATLNYPLSGTLWGEGDLLPNRCNGGPTPGKGCTDENVTGGQCGAGGTCINDWGRCESGPLVGAACTTGGCPAVPGTCQQRCVNGPTPGMACTDRNVTGGQCGGGPVPGNGGTCIRACADINQNACETDVQCPSPCQQGFCVGGSAPGRGCAPGRVTPGAGLPCPGAGAHCESLSQPCPICNPTTRVCNGGPNDGHPCTPGNSATGGDLPTSLDCPPPGPQAVFGELPLPLALRTTTVTRTAVDLPSQASVFCGFCWSPTASDFANPPVSCTSNADCLFAGGFPVCTQAVAGSFLGGTRTISETGTPPGNLTDGQAHTGTLADVFCIPPNTSSLFNLAFGGAGPGALAFPASFQLGCPSSCDDGNLCTLDICDPVGGGCQHIPTPNGAQLCDDNLPCTTDSCNVGTGSCEHTPRTDPASVASCSDGGPCNGLERCVAGVCQPGTPVSGCDPAASADATIGPNGGIVSTPDVTVDFPPTAVTSDTQVSILGLTQSTFKLGNSNRAVYTVDLQPSGQTFGVPVKIVMRWANGSDGCAVAGISPVLREHLLQVFRNGTAITATCGGVNNCPLTTIGGACVPATVCTAATCDARTDTSPNTYEVNVTSFSEYAMAAPCKQSGSTNLKVSGLTTGPGDDRLRFSGELDLVGTTLEALDPLQNGAGLVLQGSAAPVGGVSLPGGAYDTAVKAGWKVNNKRTRWTYSNRSAPPNGISKATFASTASGHVKFKFKGTHGFYPVTTDTTALVVLPDGGDCFAMSPAPTCTLNASGRTLVCR